MKLYFVYILKCTDGIYYTGVTSRLDERLSEHQAGVDSSLYTHKRRPVILVYTAEFQYVEEAIQFEKQIKGWTRKKKDALIKGNICELKSLSRGHGSSGSP